MATTAVTKPAPRRVPAQRARPREKVAAKSGLRTITDFNKLDTLATGARAVGILSQATRGDLLRSVRSREILTPLGIGDELRAGLAVDGLCWGHLT